ncbi:MAG: hypothetical protein LKM30_07030 [Bacilli bacterium]|jgi:hypothetical protein|nr:hypothetical protein [Bacilli bacterium]
MQHYKIYFHLQINILINMHKKTKKLFSLFTITFLLSSLLSSKENNIICLSNRLNANSCGIDSAALKIGNPNENYVALEYGASDREDAVIKEALNLMVSVLYPELGNLNPGSNYPALPDSSSSTYQNELLQYQTYDQMYPVTGNNYVAMLNSMVLNPFQRSQNNALALSNSTSHYCQTYDFSNLNSYLSELADHITELKISSAFSTFLSFVTGGLFLGVKIAINGYLYSTLYLLSSNFLGRVNKYETSVINHYLSNGLLNPISLENCKEAADKSKDTAQNYFLPYFLNLGDNTLDAFRHTYWTMQMCHIVNTSFAKDFTDSHEYVNVNGNISESGLLSTDMDLLNNNNAILNFNFFSRNESPLLTSIGTSDWSEGLAFYSAHTVAYGYSYNVRTFSNETYKTEPIKEGYVASDAEHPGLKFTNFGEIPAFKTLHPGRAYEKNSMLFYPPLC